MSDTHQWDVYIEETGPDVILEINYNASVFKTGPFVPGEQSADLGVVNINNIGTDIGEGYWKVVRFPGETNEYIMYQGTWTNIPPGTNVDAAQLWGQIPDPYPDPTMPVGVKVWGEGETEPTWSTLGTMIWGGKLQIENYILPAIAIIGGIATIYYIFKK